jgi:hypothetical protein
MPADSRLAVRQSVFAQALSKVASKIIAARCIICLLIGMSVASIIEKNYQKSALSPSKVS